MNHAVDVVQRACGLCHPFMYFLVTPDAHSQSSSAKELRILTLISDAKIGKDKKLARKVPLFTEIKLCIL